MITSAMLALLVAAATPAGGQATADTVKPVGAREKQVCKRFVDTGSLVRRYRVCKAEWEWERERENIRQLRTPGACGRDGGAC